MKVMQFKFDAAANIRCEKRPQFIEDEILDDLRTGFNC